GGCDSNLSWSLPRAPLAGETACRVTIRGLRGGHSGGDIHEGRGNAIKILVRVLQAVDAARLIEFEGGSMRNAIPREAHAIVAIPPDLKAALRDGAAGVQAQARAESYEPALSITVEDADSDAALTAPDTRRWLAALTALPDG